MLFILLAVLIDMMTVGVIMPVLPALVGRFAESKCDNAPWCGTVAGGLAAANAVLGLCTMPEPLPMEQRSPLAWRRLPPLVAFTISRASMASACSPS